MSTCLGCRQRPLSPGLPYFCTHCRAAIWRSMGRGAVSSGSHHGSGLRTTTATTREGGMPNEERFARRAAHGEGRGMTGQCRRCACNSCPLLSPAGWCHACIREMVSPGTKAQWETALMTTWAAAALNAPGASERQAAADAEDVRRVIAWKCAAE